MTVMTKNVLMSRQVAAVLT